MYLKLAWRNIWRNHRRTLITTSAIVFAVIASVFMQSMNRGSHEMILANMLRFSTGYIQIQDYRFEGEPSLDNSFPFDADFEKNLYEKHHRIESIVPRIETFMLAANDYSTRGAVIFGIDIEKEHAFNNLKDRLKEGSFFDSNNQGAVLGEGLARRLQLGVGDELVLLGQGRFGMSASGIFAISGIIENPIRDLNNQVVYLPLEEAQYLLSADGHITSLLVNPVSDRHTNSVTSALRAEFENSELIVKPWPELLPELLELFEFDLATPRLLTVILYMVIGFGFFGTILTMTMERLKEFGVLLSVGMRREKLALVVFLETLFISLIGVISGIIIAWLLIFYFHLNPVELTGEAAQAVMDMGFDPILPMSFASDQFYTQGFFVFVIAMIVFMFPLIKILGLNILEAARS